MEPLLQPPWNLERTLKEIPNLLEGGAMQEQNYGVEYIPSVKMLLNDRTLLSSPLSTPLEEPSVLLIEAPFLTCDLLMLSRGATRGPTQAGGQGGFRV